MVYRMNRAYALAISGRSGMSFVHTRAKKVHQKSPGPMSFPLRLTRVMIAKI